MSAEQDGLDVVEDGAVLRITLNRRAAGNAINQAVMAGLLAALDGAKAERWGMINEVVPDGELEDAVERVVQEFACAATVSVGLAKVLVHRNLDASLSQALVQEELMEEASVRSADFKEGIAAMMQKRDPKFSGR